MKVKKSDIKKYVPDSIVEGVSSSVFLRHLPLVILLVFFALGYISVRFDCVTAMETVASLNRKLEIIRTETQRERSMYMSATCESSMQQMVDTMGLGLHVQERLPYQIPMP
jgi:hypothetical protein